MAEEKNFKVNGVGESGTLPDPSVLEYYKDRDNRIIWIDDEINEDTLEVIRSIIGFNMEDRGIPVEERKPVKIMIDTNGGDVQVTMSIIGAIKASKTPVYTVNLCNALSAGAHLLAAGKKRYALPGSTVLIHSGGVTICGDVEKAESARKYLEQMGNRMNEILLEDTKINPKIMKKKAPFDWYLSAEDALENGVVDAIVSDFDEVF